MTSKEDRSDVQAEVQEFARELANVLLGELTSERARDVIEQRIQLVDEFVAAGVEELRAAYANPEFGGGPPEILAPAIRARDTAIVEAACAAIREACSQCENGNVVTEGVEYGHACGGDDRKCATSCPVEVQVQDVSECEYCGRPIAAIRTALAYLLEPEK